jgi:putative toxin-antitoxin system antitoxin component (TIGR02293 family)
MPSPSTNHNKIERVPVPAEVFTDREAYLRAVHKGISGAVIKSAVELYGYRELFSRLLDVTSSNLSRVYSRKTLGAHQSESTLDTLRILRKADQVFGDPDMASEWFQSTVIALGGLQPIELLDTFEGRRMVGEVLEKIACGDFS